MDYTNPDVVVASLKTGSKKQLLHDLAALGAKQAGVDERLVFDILMERERLGTTGIGNGIAIPHAKVPGVDQVTGVFARLEHAVDYDAIDDAPVDLVYLMLAPAGAGGDHLKALARISRTLRNKMICEKLRGARNEDALMAILSEPEETSFAA